MQKLPTGMPGFDDIAIGGLPTGRTTLLTGGPGSGKTVFALQSLVHWATARGEPGIFVAFEQAPAALRADAATFDWELSAVSEAMLTFIDARPNLNLVRAGAFDIGGMLAVLEAQVKARGAKAIVFDGIDVLLAQMGEPEAIRRELYRLQHWLEKSELTAIITCKATISDPKFIGLPSPEFLQYMVDCSVMLNHDMVDEVSQRSLRISKYRGSGFHGNTVPFLIGDGGVEVSLAHTARPTYLSTPLEKISAGSAGIDEMLQGGYFRSSCVLLTGLPGTGKTTLAASFLETACARGEKALFVSFVSRPEEIIHNLRSVSIDLERFQTNGQLKFVSTRVAVGSGETHLRSIRHIARNHDAACIVIDPLTALTSFVDRRTAPGLTERLIDWAKSEARTLVCTGVLDNPDQLREAPLFQTSSISDTWIHLTNAVQGPGRTREVAVMKSRGTGHSSQIRDFILTDSGMRLIESTDGGRLK